jgi:hypothetical protein
MKHFGLRIFLTVALAFVIIPSATALENNIHSFGKQLDVDFETISGKLIEMESLVTNEANYQSYLSKLQVASASLDTEALALKSLSENKDLNGEEIQNEIDRVEKFKTTVNLLKDELVKIPVSTFSDPLALANSVMDVPSSIRPVIVDLKFSETFPSRKVNESFNGNDQQIFVTWQMTVKSKNLIKGIAVLAPPDFSGIFEPSQSRINLDDNFSTNKVPAKNQPSLLLIKRQFVDGWLFETFIGRQWMYFDKSKNYLMAVANTGMESDNLTCRIFVNNSFTFDELTPGCTENEHFTIQLPEITNSQAAFENSLSRRFESVWNNRDRYRSLVSKLNSYHVLEPLNVDYLNDALFSYEQLKVDVDVFKKQQLDRIAQLRLVQLKKLSEQAQSLSPKKASIICVKGKLTKKITGVKPKCPSGFKVKK